MSEWVDDPSIDNEWVDDEKPSVVESGIRGLTSGLSAGFSDELSGGLEALGTAAGVKGIGKDFGEQELSDDGPTLDWEVLKHAYKAQRDSYRKKMKKDSDENPVASGAGQLVGAVASPLNKIMPGNIVKQGAALGGITGLGMSEADNVGEMALDTAKGAGMGAALGKGFQEVGKLANQGASKMASFISPAKKKLNADQIREAADRLGIKVTPGMLDDSGFVERLEGVLSKSPSFLGQHVNRNQKAVVERLMSASDDALSEAGNLSPYQLGETFKSGVAAKVGERLDPLSAVFDEVAESTKNIPIGDKSKAAIKRNIENLDVFRLTGGSGKASQYAEMIPKLKNADEVKTAMTLLRKDIQSAEGAEKQVLLAIKEKLATLEKNSIMRGAIQTAKEGGLRNGKQIGRDIVGDLRDARTGYRELSQDLGSVAENARLKTQSGPSAFLDSLEAVPSERMSDKFFNTENNRQLMNLKEKFPEQFDLLKGGKLKDIKDAAIDNSMNGQGKLSPQKFLNQSRDLNPEAKQMLFGDKSGLVDDIQTVQQSLPRNFNPSGTASEQGWTDALYRNVKDIPTFMLYKGASSNLAGDISKNLLKSPQMLDVYKKNPELFQNMVNQLEQKAGILSAPGQKALPRSAEDQDASTKPVYDKGAMMQKVQGSKYAQVLQSAADRSDQSLAAAHFVLASRDPEYRKLVN